MNVGMMMGMDNMMLAQLLRDMQVSRKWDNI
jgi:hypothetical protein